MYRKFCLMLLILLLPAAALADTTITLTFAGDVTLGGEDYLRSAPDSFASVYAANGPDGYKAIRETLPNIPCVPTAPTDDGGTAAAVSPIFPPPDPRARIYLQVVEEPNPTA